MRRESLERVDEQSWPELRRVLAWSFVSPEENWRLAWERLDELWMVRGPRGAEGGFGLYRPKIVVGGRALPVGGFAGVGIRPESRASGLGARMMAAGLDLLHHEGLPLAALYPSTEAFYRKLGFELAGHRIEYEIGSRDIGLRAGGLRVEECEEAELRRRQRVQHGHLLRTDGLWARLLRPIGGATRAYAVGGGAYLATWLESFGPHGLLHVRDVGFADAEEAREAWALLAGLSTMVERVRWVGPPDDPFGALLPNLRQATTRWLRWMLRIVDLRAAMALRGWAADGVLELDVLDEILPQNGGRWRLVVEAGQGRVEPGGAGGLRVHIRGLSSLYMGYSDPWRLRDWGAIDGEPAALEAAARLFRSPEIGRAHV